MTDLRDSLRFVLIVDDQNAFLRSYRAPIEQALHVGVEEYDIVGTSPYNLEISKLKIVVRELRKKVVEIEFLTAREDIVKLRSDAEKMCKVGYQACMDAASLITVDDYNKAVLGLREYIYQLDCFRGHDM